MSATPIFLIALLTAASPCAEPLPEEPAPSSGSSQQASDALLASYTETLANYVDASTGLVAYSRLRSDSAKMKALDAFARSPLPSGATPDEQMAAKVNRYNARVLHQVATDFPRFSKQSNGVLSQDDFFKRAVALEGSQVSLNDYEAGIRNLGFPAVHFIVNCGSRGCPRLAAKPFDGKTIRTVAAKLEADALQATSSVKSENGKQVVEVIELLFWYGKDFTGVDPSAEAAKHQAGLRKYILGRIPAGKSPLRQALVSGASIRSRSDWNWSVNGS